MHLFEMIWIFRELFLDVIRVWILATGINTWARSLTPSAYSSWELTCKITMTIQLYAIIGDFLSIFLITVDRFLCIVFPLKHPIFVTKKRLFTALCITFLMTSPIPGLYVWFPDRSDFYFAILITKNILIIL